MEIYSTCITGVEDLIITVTFDDEHVCPTKKKNTKKTRPPEEKAKGGGGREDMRQPGSICHFYRDEEKNFSLKKVRLLKVKLPRQYQLNHLRIFFFDTTYFLRSLR